MYGSFANAEKELALTNAKAEGVRCVEILCIVRQSGDRGSIGGVERPFGVFYDILKILQF